MSDSTHLLIHVFLCHFFVSNTRKHDLCTGSRTDQRKCNIVFFFSVLGHVQIRESVTLCSFFCVGDLSEFVEEKIIKEKKNVKTRCSATS